MNTSGVHKFDCKNITVYRPQNKEILNTTEIEQYHFHNVLFLMKPFQITC